MSQYTDEKVNEILSSSNEDILLDEISRLKEENGNFKSFTDEIIRHAFNDTFIDGDIIREIGMQTKVLKADKLDDFIDDSDNFACYRKTYS